MKQHDLTSFTAMPQETPQPPEEATIIRRESGLAILPNGGAPALSEIINRSLVHIQTSKALGMRHRIGEHELCGPDYHLVCAWADELWMTPEGVLQQLMDEPNEEWYKGWQTFIEDGHFKTLLVNRKALPFSVLPTITGLSIRRLCLGGGENISKLDLASVPDLTELDCSGSQLAELDLSQIPHLTALFCQENQLSNLDISPVSDLTELGCWENQLTDLDLSAVCNLTNLFCWENQLTCLDLSPVPNLINLFCRKNKLTELDLSKVHELSLLWCENNQLTGLDLSESHNLAELSCDGNQLSELALSDVPNLTVLSCIKNQLTELDIRNLGNLETLKYDPGTRIIQRPDQNF